MTERIARLTHGVSGVLLTADRLEPAREAFGEHHLGALGRHLNRDSSNNTIRGYRADWVQWETWCATENLQALPAAPIDVAAWLAAAARATKTHDRSTGSGRTGPAYALKSLQRRRDAIAAIHAAHDLPDPTSSAVVRQTLSWIRATRLADAPPPQPRATLRPEHLEQMLHHLPGPDWPDGVRRRRDRLILLAGAGGLRDTELVALTLGDITVRNDPACAASLLKIHLRHAASEDEFVLIPRQDPELFCPVCAFIDWLEVLEAHHEGGDSQVEQLLIRASNAVGPAGRHRCMTYSGAGPADGTRPLLRRIQQGHLGRPPAQAVIIKTIVRDYIAQIGLSPSMYGGNTLHALFRHTIALGGPLERTLVSEGGWTPAGVINRFRPHKTANDSWRT